MMEQDNRWKIKYNEVVKFIETNHRNPSKYDPEERGLYCNWIRHNKKVLSSGEMKAERVELFKELLAMMEENKRVNQYQ